MEKLKYGRKKGKARNCLHNVYLSLNRPYKMNYLIYMVYLGLNLMNINHLENYIIIFTAAEGISLEFSVFLQQLLFLLQLQESFTFFSILNISNVNM